MWRGGSKMAAQEDPKLTSSNKYIKSAVTCGSFPSEKDLESTGTVHNKG